MVQDLILVLDAGTTSTRALLFDLHGQVVAQAAEPINQHFPQSGWVEHDACEIADKSAAVLRAALAQCPAGASVAALGLTNQRETVVVWNRATGLPVHKAIVWQDRRTADACAALRDGGHEPTVAAATGLRLDPYFSATKIAWILDHVDGARDAASRGDLLAGTIDCWLTWLWTGEHITDATNASRTLLYDLHSGDWSAALCDLFRVPMHLLPRVCDSAGQLAMVRAEVAGRTLALTGMAGDQQAAAIGQDCLRRGMAKATFGTGAFLLVHAGEVPVISRHQLLGTVAWQLKGARTYALEGSLFVAGSAVQWLRDGLGLIQRSDETAALAASIPSCDGVYLVPAFAGLGAPYWDADARGLICGLTRGTTRAHIVRATLEAMSYQTADLLESFRADGLPVERLRIDGGMAANNWLMNDMAAILDMPVERPAVLETTGWGVARLAMVGAGVAADLASSGGAWAAEAVAHPRAGPDRAARLAGWRRAVARARSGA